MTSIIIPCYNVERYVGRTIDSVIRQTNEDWEIIAVDDGSSDETLKVLRSYSERDDRISIFSKENGGVSSARNFGLSKSSGDWIYFLDADDLINPDLINFIEKTGDETDILVFGFEKQSQSGKCIKYIPNPNITDTLNSFLTNRIKICMCSIAIKNNLLTKYKIIFNENTSYSEDREFIAQSIYHSKNIKIRESILFSYLYRSESAMNTNIHYTDKKFSSVLACERIYKQLKGTSHENAALVQLKTTIGIHLVAYLDKFDINSNAYKQLKDYAEKYFKMSNHFPKNRDEAFSSAIGFIYQIKPKEISNLIMKFIHTIL